MAENTGPSLQRKLGVFNATTINMSNMVGIGPFITIPIILSTLGGPHSYLAWLVGVLIALADGLVVSELGAAIPASGGSYAFIREGFGPKTWGRMLAFLSPGSCCSRGLLKLPPAISAWSSTFGFSGLPSHRCK